MNKSRKKIAQDESRNAIADSKSSSKAIRKDGKYEGRMAVKEAAGEGPSMRGMSMRKLKKSFMSNIMGSGLNMTAGSPISKHMKR
jgi:hypothetical protein